MNAISMMVGPTCVPERVLKAMHRASISHRSNTYCQLQKEITEGMKKIFHTNNDVYMLTASSTGAMEAAILNCLAIGDEVVIAVLGNFSKQYADMCDSFGLQVKRVEFPLGEAACVERIKDEVTDSTKAIFIVHNESATGVTNDLKAFGDAFKNSDILLICDSVSGAAGIPTLMDEWGIDIFLTGSQKALMSPAGLSFISLSEKAWKATERSNFNHYYFNLKEAKKFGIQNQTQNTPAVYNVFAVHEAINMILEEGIENVYQRHEAIHQILIRGLKNLGLDPFVQEESIRSRTVTSVYTPQRALKIVNDLAKEGVFINSGLPPITQDVFRIGTMGYVFPETVKSFLNILSQVL